MATNNDSFFSKLTRLFRSGTAIRRKIKGRAGYEPYDKKALMHGGMNHGAGLMPFGRSSTQNNQMTMIGGSDLPSRMSRYMDYAQMEYTPLISKALDITADECCAGDEKGKNFHIYSENKQVKETLEELFYEVLNVDFNLRVWFRNIVKYGDFFLYNEVVQGEGIVNVVPLNVNEVEREEYFDPKDPYAVRYKSHRFGQKHLENWQVTHFRILGNDRFLPYGTSMLESARKIWSQYVMMVDAMLVYRLVRSPERRVFYVDVGAVSANDIPNYMQTIMGTIKGNMAVDKATGRMDERFGPTDVLEDYVVPVKGANSGTKIDTLQGGMNATAVEDIELIRSELFAALGVPKAYLGFDELLGSKATLSQIDIRFSKTIQILQKIVVHELKNMAILHLYAKGFEGEDLINFDLRLSNPSTIALQQKLDLWKTKMDIIGTHDQIETKFLNKKFLYKEILEFSDDQIKEIEEGLIRDKKFAAKLESIVDPDDESAPTVDLFDKTAHGTPGGGNMTQIAPSRLPGSQGEVEKYQVGDNPVSVSETPLSMPSDSSVPIKSNPNVTADKKNQRRRKSELEKQAHHSDFNKMLDPKTNVSLRDIYDNEFLKNPIGEQVKRIIEEDIKTYFASTNNREIRVNKSLKSVLENFNKFNKKLPVEIELLTEDNQSAKIEDEELIEFEDEFIGDDSPNLSFSESDDISLEFQGFLKEDRNSKKNPLVSQKELEELK